MAAKKYSECDFDEATLYAEEYYATTDGLEDAIAKFKILASDSPLECSKSLYRMKILETQRDLGTVKAKRRAFLNEDASIGPPSEQQVAATVSLARELAQIQANENKANAIVDISRRLAETFVRLHI